MGEQWKDIRGYEGIYKISNKGEVKSFTKKSKGNKISGWVQNTGYLAICLGNKKYSIHRLVAETFIPNPNNYPIINHKDGNKLNNNVENLEWCTYKHNLNEAIRLGLIKIKYASKNNKIRAKKVKQYTLDNVYVASYNGSVEAQQELNKRNIKVDARNIRSVCENKRKTAGGFIWKYEVM